jgi:hypothetical protein
MRNTLVTLVMAIGFTGAAVAGSDKCNAGPKEQWKPQAELEKKLAAEGWKIKKVKIDAGCYEVYGTDKDGKRVEMYFDPKTFEPVKTP